MNRKMLIRIGPPILFFVAVFIYAVILDGPIGLPQLLITALTIMVAWAVSVRLIEPKQHRNT